ncbi:hypothetical protein [Sphingobium sp. ba1]|jgi:hypothetical protein|uniref:hypothetical protein n=1 Tax=Sphingobium sp. ba1 TaxID=1522072 RepID=UPI0012E0AE79|nr:hypothetical protein [Sphingobium sp. ba1]
MNLNVAALEVLVAKGLSAQDILEVARALSVKSDPTAAERQQRRRDRLKGNAETSRRDVTRDPPNDIYSNPPELTPNDDKSSLTPKPKTRKAATGDALPEGWTPALTPAAQQIVDGWPPGWLDARLAEFTDHAADKGRKSKDWQAAFRQWLIKADTWGRPRNGNDRQSSANRNRGRDGFLNACHEAADAQARHPFAGNG